MAAIHWLEYFSRCCELRVENRKGTSFGRAPQALRDLVNYAPRNENFVLVGFVEQRS
jgi:hypothetical protein